MIVDRTVCINLIERPDRFKQAQEQFESVGLQAEFYHAQRHSRGGSYGCYDSHRNVIQKAFNDGLETVLIFEDDVQFTDGWETVFDDTTKFLEEGTEFDAYFLNSFMHYVEEKTFDRIWKVKCTLAHAYIVSRKGMEKFLANSAKFEEEVGRKCQDSVQMSVWQDIYGHTNKCIIQDASFGSDNFQSWMPEIPDRYAEWFRSQVMLKYMMMIQPILRSDIWRWSLGRRYVLAADDLTIDDGRIHLRLWLADIFLILFTATFLTTTPPHGYFVGAYDLVVTCSIAVGKRWGMKNC